MAERNFGCEWRRKFSPAILRTDRRDEARRHPQRPGEFPADFGAGAGGKKADYAVTVNEIKQKVLPELDDAFAAKLLPGKTLADLRHTMEHDLEHEKEHEIERAKESQIVKFLHEHISFDLPPTC